MDDLLSINWRVADCNSPQFAAGYQHACTVGAMMPDGETRSLWFALVTNRPALNSTEDFKAGYQRYVDEMVARFYIYSPKHRAYWMRSVTGTEWPGHTTNIHQAGTWDQQECDHLQERYGIDPANFIRTSMSLESFPIELGSKRRNSVLDAAYGDMIVMLRIVRQYEPGADFCRAAETIQRLSIILQHGGDQLTDDDFCRGDN